jgi:hypothetical protein
MADEEVTGANFWAYCLSLCRGGLNQFGEVWNLGAGQAQVARTRFDRIFKRSELAT